MNCSKCVEAGPTLSVCSVPNNGSGPVTGAHGSPPRSAAAHGTTCPLRWTPENLHASLAAIRSFPASGPDELNAMAAIGLEEQDFDFFRLAFVGEPWSYSERALDADAWSLRRDQRVSTRRLVSHLAGQRWVGTGARWDAALNKFRTHSFVIDLDSGSGTSDIHRRYDAVCEALGCPSLLFRSSASGGLHLHYFVDQDVDLFRIRNALGDRGAVMRLLGANGLVEQPGRIEVYPRGKFRYRGVQGRLRLPFGAESRLLQDDLTPMCSGADPLDDLRTVHTLFADSKVTLLNIEELAAAASSAPWPIRTRTSARAVGRRDDAAIDGREAYVRRLKAEGLQEAGEFNRAISALAFDSRWSWVPPDDAVAAIEEWLSRMHNGHSRTWSETPLRAREEIAAVVARIYARHSPREWAPRLPLSQFEAATVLRLTNRAKVVVDPLTGEELNRLKLQRFAFELLKSAKQLVLTRGEHELARLRAEQPGSVHHTDAFADELAWRCRAFWPDSNAMTFVVECPYTHRVSLPLISEKTVGPYWRALLKSGVYTLARPSAWPKAICATYRVELDFGSRGNDDVHLDTADAAVCLLTAPKVIRRRYTRHAARQIMAAATSSPIARPPRLAFEELIRQRLTDARSTSRAA